MAWAAVTTGPPEAVSSLTVVSGIDDGDSRLTATWAAPDTAEPMAYDVRWRESGTLDWHDVAATDTTASATIRTITGVPNETLLRVQVRAHLISDPTITGEWAQTSAMSHTPAGLVVTDGSDAGDVVVTWNASPAGDYRLRYRLASSDSWTQTGLQGNRTSTHLTGLLPGRNYLIELQPADRWALAPWSPPTNFTATQGPGPVAVTATPLHRSVRLEWGAPGTDPVTAYQVRYRQQASESWLPATTLTADTLATTIDGLTDGEMYIFAVRAFDHGVGGQWAEVGAAPVTPPIPSPVEGVEATPGDGEELISWTVSSTDVAYDVRWRQSGTSEWHDVTATDTDTLNSRMVTGLTNEVLYRFEVRAHRLDDPSIASDWVLVNGIPVTPRPGTPGTPVARLQATHGSVQISGGQLSDPSDHFEVHYVAPDGTESQIDLPAGSTEGVVSGLALGDYYDFYLIERSSRASSAAGPRVSVMYPNLTLPTMRIDTTNGAPIVSKDDYISAQLNVDPNGSDVSAASVPLDIKGRGNSTWPAPKKPYRLKLGSATSLFGMPSSKHWVLLANWYDKSSLHNAAALTFGQATNLAWTPKFAYVEVVLNGDYIGLYQVVEQVRIDPNRVNIDSLKSTDNSGTKLTGGYLFERDGHYDPSVDVGFTGGSGLGYSLDDPESPTSAQLDYISSYVTQTENSLGATGTDYQSLLDTGSFVDWYLVEELTMNQDAGYSSAYMYKPRNGKLMAGPLWDFDLSMGTMFGQGTTAPPTGWWVRDTSFWFNRLLGHEAFAQAVRSRWADLEPLIKQSLARVRELDSAISTARMNDATRWGYVAEKSSQSMFTWLQDRMDWIDQNINSL